MKQIFYCSYNRRNESINKKIKRKKKGVTNLKRTKVTTKKLCDIKFPSLYKHAYLTFFIKTLPFLCQKPTLILTDMFLSCT